MRGVQRLKKFSKSDFQTFKISRLQGCKVAKASKSDFLASTLLNLGSMGGGGDKYKCFKL